jgi:hypothetical protein
LADFVLQRVVPFLGFTERQSCQVNARAIFGSLNYDVDYVETDAKMIVALVKYDTYRAEAQTEVDMYLVVEAKAKTYTSYRVFIEISFQQQKSNWG